MNNSEKRKMHTTVRLARLIRLRELNSPKWVIKSEQIALLLNRRGKKHAGIGKDGSKEQGRLYEKFVLPHMGAEDKVE